MSLLRRGSGRMGLVTLLVIGCPAGEAGQDTTEIRLAVSAGDHAGTVETTTQDVICTEGLVGAGSWGVQYSDPQLTTPLGSMQLIVPRQSEDGTASRFYLGIVFESFLNGVDHEIETREGSDRPRGEGMVTIHTGDSTAALTVTGHTADGIGISARIRCHQVRRPATALGDNREENREP